MFLLVAVTIQQAISNLRKELAFNFLELGGKYHECFQIQSVHHRLILAEAPMTKEGFLYIIHYSFYFYFLFSHLALSSFSSPRHVHGACMMREPSHQRGCMLNAKCRPTVPSPLATKAACFGIVVCVAIWCPTINYDRPKTNRHGG